MSITKIAPVNINKSSHNLSFGNSNDRHGNTTNEHRPVMKDDKKRTSVKLGVLATTLLGAGTALAAISKKQGFSLNFSKIKNTKMKDWAIFKLPKDKNDTSKVLEFKEKEILFMAAASVSGGLLGGIAFDDKKHRRSKVKEAVNQMLGDVIVPLAFVAGPTRLYQAFEDLYKENKNTKHVKLKNAAKYVSTNKFLKIILPVVVSGSSLATGIIAGNKVSNYINEKLHKEKVERKIKATDFAPHVDDVCLAVTLMAEKSPLSSFISKLVPFALLVPGLETGNAKKHNHNPKQEEIKN